MTYPLKIGKERSQSYDEPDARTRQGICVSILD